MAKKKKRITYGLHCKVCNRFNGTQILPVKSDYNVDGMMKYCPGGDCKKHQPHLHKKIPKPQ